MFLRAVGAFLALPGVVAFLAPLLLAAPALRDGRFHLIALVPLALGGALLVWCARQFFTEGRGTLAPWAPPRQLVTGGPYAYSRNPMYIAVALILIGWVLAFRSTVSLVYALAVLVAFHLRVRLHEEPRLSATFHETWRRYSARVPRWIFRRRRHAVLATVAAVAALVFAGLVFEAYADAAGAREFPAPGMMVDVGGRRLHLVCIGEGTPTVLFEPSGFSNAMSYEQARGRIATRTRVCSYDRMGTGWSDPGPSDVSAGDLANDLAVLQDRAALGSPLVLVASSIGGLTAETLARRHPERVAALVFLDAANSGLAAQATPGLLATAKAAGCTAAVAARFGLVRLADPFGIGTDSSEGARRSAAVTYHARTWGTICALLRGLPRTQRELGELPPLPSGVPLVVLSASTERDHVPGFTWIAADLRGGRIPSHQELAKRSSRGKWALIPDSGHLLAGDKPDVVADTVLELLEQLDEAGGYDPEGSLSIPAGRDYNAAAGG
jgi:protein-S-isoprenylcysteine O-methyltransferase Ste14/pimeloyl-ACP methyl ester carboxylesterase